MNKITFVNRNGKSSNDIEDMSIGHNNDNEKKKVTLIIRTRSIIYSLYAIEIE